MGYAVVITRSPNRLKKFRAVITDGTRTTSVDFGQAGASDYTIHKDLLRMFRYVARHSHPSDLTGVQHIKLEGYNLRTRRAMLQAEYERVNSTKEHWGIDGIRTAGFWSRWLLWSKPSLRGGARTITSKFRGVRIRLDLNG